MSGNRPYIPIWGKSASSRQDSSAVLTFLDAAVDGLQQIVVPPDCSRVEAAVQPVQCTVRQDGVQATLCAHMVLAHRSLVPCSRFTPSNDATRVSASMVRVKTQQGPTLMEQSHEGGIHSNYHCVLPLIRCGGWTDAVKPS